LREIDLDEGIAAMASLNVVRQGPDAFTFCVGNTVSTFFIFDDVFPRCDSHWLAINED